MTTLKTEEKPQAAKSLPVPETPDKPVLEAEQTQESGVTKQAVEEMPLEETAPAEAKPASESVAAKQPELPSTAQAFDPAAIAAMQQRITGLERERLEAQENRRDGEELSQYRAELEGEELTPKVVDGLIRRVAQIQAYRRRVAQEAAQSQQRNVDAYYAFAGKLLAAQDLAQDTGMAFKDLFALGTLGEMQQAAKAFKAERELVKEKQARVTPVKLPSATPGQSRPTITMDNIDKLYLEGKVSDSFYRQFLETREIRS